MKQKENWLLKRINECIEKNGRIDEECLKLIYTQINYRDENLELVEKFHSIPYVAAYLFMKKNNECQELLETFEKKQQVQSYLYMVRQIEMVDEIIEKLKQNNWCRHILVGDGTKHRCIRCGVTIDDLDNYPITDFADYNEARLLYEGLVNDIEYEHIDNIINGMILLRNEQKVKSKRLY